MNGAFAALPHAVLESPGFISLSPYAVKLLVDLMLQYRGKNNGDLTMAWSVMAARGWRSKASLYNARKELLEAGFILLTRQGGKRVPSLYAITWQPVDACGGKLDVATQTSSSSWENDAPENNSLVRQAG